MRSMTEVFANLIWLIGYAVMAFGGLRLSWIIIDWAFVGILKQLGAWSQVFDYLRHRKKFNAWLSEQDSNSSSHS